MSRDATRPGVACDHLARHRSHMETAQPEGLLALTLIVAASLFVLVYVFLRMAGVIGRKAHRRGRPPPSSPLG